MADAVGGDKSRQIALEAFYAKGKSDKTSLALLNAAKDRVAAKNAGGTEGAQQPSWASANSETGAAANLSQPQPNGGPRLNSGRAPWRPDSGQPASVQGGKNAGAAADSKDTNGTPPWLRRVDVRSGAAGVVAAAAEKANATRGLEIPPNKTVVPAVDLTHKPEAGKGPLTDHELGKAGKSSITAGKQYGPVFPNAETATEYARMGVRQGWFKNAAVTGSGNTFSVYEAQLPRSFSTDMNGTNIGGYPTATGLTAVAPSAGSVAENLKAVQPGSDLATLVTHEGIIGDYRGLQPKVEYAGLNGDATKAKKQLFDAAQSKSPDAAVKMFPDAAKDQAQAKLDKVERAAKTMQGQIKTSYGMLGLTSSSEFTPEGTKAVTNGLNDTAEINRKLIENEKKFHEDAQQLKALAEEQARYAFQHQARKEDGIIVNPKEVQDAHTVDRYYDKQIDDKIAELRKTHDETTALYERRNRILQENNAAFLARLTPQESVNATEKLNKGTEAERGEARKELAVDLRKKAEGVLSDVDRMRTKIANGDFGWWKYDRLIGETAGNLGFNEKQYKALGADVASRRTWDSRIETAEGLAALGLAFVPGGGWVGTGARIGADVLAGHIVVKDIDAFLTDRSLRNASLDPAHSVFASQGAPSETGVALAAAALVPEAKALIGSSMKALRSGEQIAPGTLEAWVKASPKAADRAWYQETLSKLRNAAGYYRGTGGIEIKEVNGAGLAAATKEEGVLGVFNVRKTASGDLEAKVLMRDNLTAAERQRVLQHDGAIHAEQLADPAMRENMAKLADLDKRWPTMSEPERRAAKQAQLELEIDALAKEEARAESTAARENARQARAGYEKQLADLKVGRANLSKPPYLMARGLHGSIENAVIDHLIAHNDLYAEAYSLEKLSGPNKVANLDPLLGPNQVRYYARMHNEVTGERVNYSITYDVDTGQTGSIHLSSDQP